VTFNFNMKNAVQNVFALLYGMLGCAIVMGLMHIMHPSSSTLGTVDITGIINQFIKLESAKNDSPDVVKEDVRAFAHQLEMTLRQLAKEKHLVLLLRDAVSAGGQDYTDVVNQRMQGWVNAHQTNGNEVV